MNDKYTYIIGKTSGSGGEGTSDYNKLSNKPSINGQTLQGDITIETEAIKTIEVDNIYVEETDFWPNYRIHQDVLIPLLQSGEEFQLKEHFKNEWEEGYRYYRLQSYRKQKVEKGGFIDADFFQYPTITYNGGYVKSIRYYGEPNAEGYYTAYLSDNHIVPEPWRIDIGDGSQYFDKSQELYGLLRNIKQDFDQKRDGTVTSEIMLYEYVSDTNDIIRYYHTYVKTDNDRWPWDIPEGEESTIVLFAQGTDVNGNLITLKLTAHKLEDGTYENTKEYIEGGGENVGRKTFYLDIINTTSYEAKMQAAEIAQYAIQNQTTDFVVIGLNNKDNTLTSTEIATNGVNELTINFQWGNGREYIILTANSPTDIDIRRDGVTYATLQDLEEINTILSSI